MRCLVLNSRTFEELQQLRGYFQLPEYNPKVNYQLEIDCDLWTSHNDL